MYVSQYKTLSQQWFYNKKLSSKLSIVSIFTRGQLGFDKFWLSSGEVRPGIKFQRNLVSDLFKVKSEQFSANQN